jgi:hypothetical protein
VEVNIRDTSHAVIEACNCDVRRGHYSGPLLRPATHASASGLHIQRVSGVIITLKSRGGGSVLCDNTKLTNRIVRLDCLLTHAGIEK